MRLARVNRLAGSAAVLGTLCCGGGGGTTPPGPPVDLLKSGDNQSWYFNNPLPTALSVTAVDVDGRAVPNVVVTWAVTSGGGRVSPTQSTTDANGVASTTDSIGGSTIQTVSANFTGLAGPVSFTAHATTPPTAAAVSVEDDHFNPANSVIQTGGTVTWTWNGHNTHNLTFTFGPTPLPANQGNQTTATPPPTAQRTITAVGTYNYTCTNHAGMNGTVAVVH
jgi:plastocyanin